MWVYKEKWICMTTCFFFIGQIDKKAGPTTTSISPLHVSFAVLFTTQEYTQRSPGGPRWMWAEIQWAHYVVKSIVSHHSFPWVAFVFVNVYIEQLGGSKTCVWFRMPLELHPSFSWMKAKALFFWKMLIIKDTGENISAPYWSKLYQAKINK